MDIEKSKTILDKVKSLEGITEHEWEELKRIIDEAFEKEKREQEIRLSTKSIKEILNTSLFG